MCRPHPLNCLLLLEFVHLHQNLVTLPKTYSEQFDIIFYCIVTLSVAMATIN